MAEPPPESSSAAQAEGEKKPRGLLDLAPELWTQIGRYVIDGEPTVTRFTLETNIPEQPALTKTCRVLRDELLPYYYMTKTNITITEHTMYEDIHNCGRWLSVIGKQNRQLVQNVILVLLDSIAWLEYQDTLSKEWKFGFQLGEPLVRDTRWASYIYYTPKFL